MDILFSIGCIQALFLALVIFIKKRKPIANRLLIVWLVILAFDLFLMLLVEKGYLTDERHDFTVYLMGFFQSMLIIHWPLLYVYTLFKTRISKKFAWKEFLHFSPVLLLNLAYIPIIFSFEKQKSMRINHISCHEPLFVNIDFLFRALLPVFYTILVLLLLKKHRKSIKNIYSYDAKVNLNWLKYLALTWGTVAVILIVISVFRVTIAPDIVPVKLANGIIFTILIAIIFGISIFGFTQECIIDDVKCTKPLTLSKNENNLVANQKNNGKAIQNHTQKTEKPVEDTITEQSNHLVRIMETEKPYLNSKLTINEFSEICNLPPETILSILKHKLNTNFFDFVNSYRVTEIKQMLNNPDYKDYTIEALADLSGFSSRATFYRIFKKMENMTPKQFIKNSKRN